MFLIAKGLGFLSRGKAAEKVCGVALTERRASLRGFAPASLPWVISSFLGELDQSLRYLRRPKEIDEKLMCSETPTAGTQHYGPAIYASEAWSCDLNVEELKVKSTQ